MSTLPSITTLISNPHVPSLEQVYHSLNTSENGLDAKSVEERQRTFGPNEIKKEKSFSVLSLIISQFTSFLVLLLIGAGIFSYAIGEHIDAIAILTIVIINGILGFVQEYKAEQSLASLKEIEIIEARVIREGKEQIIQAKYIVPGDILVLEEGKKMTADARIISAYSLMADESLLTGESVPVQKSAGELPETTALADRTNMLFSGSLITRGHGQAVVVSIGAKTEMGKIADQIQETVNEQTPLQKAMQKLGRMLGLICVAVVIPGVLLGIYTQQSLNEMIILAISLAVSAIPEGLPIVVTITLAIGIRRMAMVNVLVRKLSTAETLGGTDIICTDKTGTITHNQMTISHVFVPTSGVYTISGNGYNLEGTLSYDEVLSAEFAHLAQKMGQEDAIRVIEYGALCSDATVDVGDPTERAFAVALEKVQKIAAHGIRKRAQRTDEVPFNSDQKYMAVVVDRGHSMQTIVKGAPEVVLSMTNLDTEQQEKATRFINHLSKEGLRVLAVAHHEANVVKELKGLELTGLVAMYDPPREEVTAAIQTCYSAGVRVIMLTGDHEKTARAIAEKIGLVSERSLTGPELDQLDDAAFLEAANTVNIFARVSPQHKLRILEVLQKEGHLVAMTGDGVNDAPAIKRADIGIAAGSGTDLSKEVADMVLLDDNFASIVKGIEEGRRIFYNIKKVIRYLVSANFYGIAFVFSAILFRLPIPLLPLQILWINLATDALPALTLSGDKAEKDSMKQKPYKGTEEITSRTAGYAAYVGTVGFVVMFGLYILALNVWKLPIEEVRTLVFTASVVFELMLVFSIRSKHTLNLEQLSSNFMLWLAVGIGFIGQLFTIYTPLGRQIFDTVGLTPLDWMLVFLFSASGILLIEGLKWLDLHVPVLEKYIPSA